MKKLKIALIGAGKTMEEYLKVLSSYKNQLALEGIFNRTSHKASFLKKNIK